MKRLEGSGRKISYVVIHKFPLESLKVFHSQKRWTDDWHTAWINPRVPSLGVDTERDFFPVVSSFH